MLGKHLLWGGLVLAALGACGSEKKGKSDEVVKTVEQAEQIAETEDELLAKRDALFKMRSDLASKREALAQERAEIRERGGDTSAVDDKARELLKEEQDLASQEKALNDSMQEILNQRREIMAALGNISRGGGGDDIGSREASMASRERTLAKREADVAARESAIAQREESLASKWKDSCGGGGQTIIQTIDAQGSSYTKKDVEPLLARARKEMNKKGLLSSDLPEQVRQLEDEANNAMRKGDYGRARLAATQLLGTVRATKLNKAFIAAKIQRLNAMAKGKSLGPRSEALFREATALYGDAKFSQANSKLNQIYASLK